MGNSCCSDSDVIRGQSPVFQLSAVQLKDLYTEFARGQQKQRAQLQMERAQMERAQMQMAQRYQLAAARVQQLQDARRQQIEQQESNRRNSLAQEAERSNESQASDEENQAQITGQINVTRFIALSIDDDGQLQLRQFTNVQIVMGNNDCTSEPSSSELAIEPPPSIRELLTFTVVLAPGTSISMTMDFDETLNDLAEKLQKSQGYRLRDITVEGNKFTVNQHGEYSLTDLGVGKQLKVVCNSR